MIDTSISDSWSQKYIRQVVRKGYIKMLGDRTTPFVDLGDVIGDAYRTIKLEYKFVNGKLETVFPQVR